jgi:hypothetical protein
LERGFHLLFALDDHFDLTQSGCPLYSDNSRQAAYLSNKGQLNDFFGPTQEFGERYESCESGRYLSYQLAYVSSHVPFVA